MNRNTGKLLVAATIALFGIGLSADAFADLTIKKIVRCDKGMDVQNVLDRNILGLPMEILLVGPCDGFEIYQDDVFISSKHDHDCPGATVDGGIFLNSAHRIELNCLAVTGAEDGIAIIGGSNVSLDDMAIYENTRLGVLVNDGGAVSIWTSSISNNGAGISVEGGSVLLGDSQVVGNTGFGIRVTASSTLSLEYAEVSENGGGGVRVDGGSNFRFVESDFIMNGGSGISLQENSSLRSNGGTIADNTRSGIFLSWLSTARIFGGSEGGPSIFGNENGITITTGSAVHVGSSAVIPDNNSGFAIVCFDDESSVRIDAPESDIGAIDCTDFDSVSTE